jgi:prephenate dehydratase
MPEVFYLGPEGTFSHILARKKFGARTRLHACSAIEGIFDRVVAEPGTMGLVPIENSSGGTVYDSVDLLIRRAGQVFIHEELALDVRIALLGRDARNIQTIYSHFVQLKHHAEWLKAKYPHARLRAVVSTAVAAQKAAAGRQAAALASPGAAEVYGLEVLETPAVRETVNVTHFFTIGSKSAEKPPAGTKKTGLVAALPNICGSLHRFLGPFARNKVSLARIVSRPVPGQPQTYVFFLEIEGGPEDLPVAGALSRAGKLAETMTSLGTYPSGRRYKS